MIYVTSDKSKRECWLVANVSDKTITIGDLGLVPAFTPGKTQDLLRFYSRERVSNSKDLVKLVQNGTLIFQKSLEFQQINNPIDPITIDANLSPVEENELIGGVDPLLLVAKADKVINATSGNFAGLDISGNLVDSGYNILSFVPTSTTINGNALNGNITISHGSNSNLGNDDHPQYAKLSGRDGDIFKIDHIDEFTSAHGITFDKIITCSGGITDSTILNTYIPYSVNGRLTGSGDLTFDGATLKLGNETTDTSFNIFGKNNSVNSIWLRFLETQNPLFQAGAYIHYEGNLNRLYFGGITNANPGVTKDGFYIERDTGKAVFLDVKLPDSTSIGDNTVNAELLIRGGVNDSVCSHVYLLEQDGTNARIGGYLHYDGANNMLILGTTMSSVDTPSIYIPRSTASVGIGKVPTVALDVVGSQIINQIDDSNGLKIYGYEDKSTSYLKLSVNASGAALYESNVGNFFSSLFVFTNGNLACGSSGNYAFKYNTVGVSRLTLRSIDVDGAGTDGDIFVINDGTKDIRFTGYMKIGSSDSPTQALDIAGNSLISGTTYISDLTTSIYKDINNNLVLNDINTGAITLAELSCPPIVTLSGSGLSAGNQNLTGFNNKVLIKWIRVTITAGTADWSMTLYSKDDYTTGSFQIVNTRTGSYDIYLDYPYEDVDATNELHFNLTGANTYTVEIRGYKLR